LEPNKIICLTPKFFCKVRFAAETALCCRCLIEGKISRGVFASYLDIDRADIDSYLNKFGFREKNYEEIAVA